MSASHKRGEQVKHRTHRGGEHVKSKEKPYRVPFRRTHTRSECVMGSVGCRVRQWDSCQLRARWRKRRSQRGIANGMFCIFRESVVWTGSSLCFFIPLWPPPPGTFHNKLSNKKANGASKRQKEGNNEDKSRKWETDGKGKHQENKQKPEFFEKTHKTDLCLTNNSNKRA